MPISHRSELKQFTVMFSCVPWPKANPTVFTEYVYAPKDDETEAFIRAKNQAANRYSEQNNKDYSRVRTNIQRAKLLSIHDGFISTTTSPKIQKRHIPA